jgi:hypothetical protein
MTIKGFMNFGGDLMDIFSNLTNKSDESVE